MIEIAYAQQTNIRDLYDVAPAVSEYVNLAFFVLVALAVVVLVWGIFKFIIYAGDEAGRKEGRTVILWGVVGIFIMLSVWGLVNILRGTVSLDDQAPLSIPLIAP